MNVRPPVRFNVVLLEPVKPLGAKWPATFPVPLPKIVT